MKEWFKKILCRLGIHSRFVGYEKLGIDEYGEFRCRWCGKVGLVDSQHNLF